MRPDQQFSQRPRLTLKILFYAAFDVVGMVLFASGAMWLVQGTPFLFASYPANGIQASIATVVGVGLMLWAAAQILREVMRLKLPDDRGAPHD